MLDKFTTYAMEKDLDVGNLQTLHDEYNYAVVINDGKIKDFIYEDKKGEN